MKFDIVTVRTFVEDQGGWCCVVAASKERTGLSRPHHSLSSRLQENRRKYPQNVLSRSSPQMQLMEKGL